jgi:hypothetical protein
MNPNGVQFSHCGGGKPAYYMANIVTLLLILHIYSLFTESYCDKLYIITVYVLPLSETKCSIDPYILQQNNTITIYSVASCE